MADKEAERIRYETEVFKTIVLLTAAVGGGSIGLFLGEHTPLRLSVAGAGFLGTVGLAIMAWRSDLRIRRLIEEIQEDL
jgi:hypothetical protein